MKIGTLLLLFSFACTGSFAGDSAMTRVYYFKPWLDGTATGIGFITNYVGLKIIKSKNLLDSATVMQFGPEDVNPFDRPAVFQDPDFSDEAILFSNISLHTCFASPFLLLFDKAIRKDALKIGLLYLETESLVGNTYSWGVGHIKRKRPFVFNPDESLERKTGRGSQNSFYSGHVASAASCTFFIAKVYADYHPHSRWRPYIYGAAVIPPAIVGYFRYRAGMHFTSDIIAGAVVGAGIGILVPQLHKEWRQKKTNKVLLLPFSGYYSGLSLKIRLDD